MRSKRPEGHDACRKKQASHSGLYLNPQGIISVYLFHRTRWAAIKGNCCRVELELLASDGWYGKLPTLSRFYWPGSTGDMGAREMARNYLLIAGRAADL